MKREIAKEYPPPGEEQAIDEFIDLIKGHVNRIYPTGTMKRGAHPKAHGCVQAEFTVEPDLPDDLRVGVFREPKTYRAWVRLSNAGDPKSDITRDLRGMAIKLMGVTGQKNLRESPGYNEMQDFLLVSHPVFMSGNVADFLAFNQATEKGRMLLHFLNPFHLRLRELRILSDMAQSPGNMLSLKFWSVTPYLFGSNCAVKFAAFPRKPLSNQPPEKPTDDFLRDALKKTLAEQDVFYDFFVQFQVDADKMPIEDPTVLWDEALSPYRKVATLHIPKQTFDSPEQQKFCENLSFSPWHGLVEHRPLGGLNRARKRIYEALSEFRHQKNKAVEEPINDL